MVKTFVRWHIKVCKCCCTDEEIFPQFPSSWQEKSTVIAIRFQHMKRYSTKTPFTLLCCKKVIQLYKNSKITVQNRIIRLKSALSSDKAHFHTCTPYEQCPPAFSVAVLGGKKNNKIKSLFSHVSAQRCVELCETLDELLELRPLLGVQGPATSHHCKPATKKTS